MLTQVISLFHLFHSPVHSLSLQLLISPCSISTAQKKNHSKWNKFTEMLSVVLHHTTVKLNVMTKVLVLHIQFSCHSTIQEHTKFSFFQTFNGPADKCSQGFHITGHQHVCLHIKEYKRIEISHWRVNSQFACAGLMMLTANNTHWLSSMELRLFHLHFPLWHRGKPC